MFIQRSGCVAQEGGEDRDGTLLGDNRVGCFWEPEKRILHGTLKRTSQDLEDEDFAEDEAGLLEPGTILANRYEVQTLLGEGGMGCVYRAHDRFLDETVALKLLRASFASTQEATMRFRSEIKLARKVTHRNVCRIHEYSEVDGLRFLSMEYVDGQNLKELVRGTAGLPPKEVGEITTQICKGLQAIHDRGIIHRDLKNANIMRDAEGNIYLMDFGIAKRWQEREEESEPGENLTGVGDALGTPEYMSPEQARGQKLDFQSDVYSLGICIFEILTGQLPFVGATALDTLIMQIQEPPPLDDIGPEFRGVLARALAKEPEDRYASARGVIGDLREFNVEEPQAQPEARTILLVQNEIDQKIARGDSATPPEQAPRGRGARARDATTTELNRLVKALRDPEVGTRWRAAVSLCQLGPEATEALPALAEATHDATTAVSDAATAAYRAISGGAPPEEEVAKGAPVASSRPTAAGLLGALRDKDTFARWRAAVALGELGPEAAEATAALIEGLEDEDDNVRSAAAVALGKIGPAARPAARALTAALTDDDDQVFRAHVARALGRMGPGAKEAVPGLIAALCEEEVAVREEIAEALVAIGPAAVPALMEALQDDDARVRFEAATALTRLGTAPPRP